MIIMEPLKSLTKDNVSVQVLGGSKFPVTNAAGAYLPPDFESFANAWQ